MTAVTYKIESTFTSSYPFGSIPMRPAHSSRASASATPSDSSEFAVSGTTWSATTLESDDRALEIEHFHRAASSIFPQSRVETSPSEDADEGVELRVILNVDIQDISAPEFAARYEQLLDAYGSAFSAEQRSRIVFSVDAD